jgi:hypothetical protein
MVRMNRRKHGSWGGFLFCVSLFFESQCLADSQTNYAQTLVSDGGVGAVAWSTNLANAAHNTPDTFATTERFNNSTSEVIKATGFGFNIPSGAAIDGIEVEIKKGSDAGGISDHAVRLVDAGAIGSTDRSVGGFWASAGTTTVYGSTNDTWGGSWYEYQINATNFGLAISGQETNGNGNVCRVYFFKIIVHYTPTAKFAGGQADGYHEELESGLNIAPLDVDNSNGATGSTATAVCLNGTLVNADAATTVKVFWDTNDQGVAINDWAFSSNLGVQAVGDLSVNVSGFAAGATYYYRFYGTNANGYAWAWPATEFFLSAVPVLSNDEASDVDGGSATLNGSLTAGGYADITIFWGENPASWDNTVNLGEVIQGSFSTALSGLSEDTIYFYQCYATNALGEGYSPVKEWSYGTTRFKSGDADGSHEDLESGLNIAPLDIDNSNGATGSTATAVCLNGTLVSANASTTVTVFWDAIDHGATFNWANASNLGVQAVGDLTTQVSGLIPGQTYFYRFYGTNANGHAWAWPATEFYLSASPTVVNDGASDVDASSATLNGTLMAGGYADVTIYWGTDSNSWANAVNLPDVNQGAFSVGVSGLSADTVYYYVCYATNAFGEDYSEMKEWSYSSRRFAGGDADGYNEDLESGLNVAPLEIDNSNGATGSTATAVWLNGTLVNTDAPTAVTVFWDTSDKGPSTNWMFSAHIGERAVGDLSTQVSGLTLGIIYYYRFYGTNTNGHAWAWPAQTFFLSAPPLVVDDGASEVNAERATLNGTLKAGGYADVTIYWGQNPNSWSNTVILADVIQGAFSAEVSGLSADTVHYYAAYATNAFGEDWSETREWSYSTRRFAGGDADGYSHFTTNTVAHQTYTGLMILIR